MISSAPLCIGLLSALLLPAVNTSLQVSQQQFEAGNYQGAVTTLRAALAQAPDDACLAFWLARSHYELHDYDNAVDYAERAVKQDPRNSEYHRWLGRAYGGKADKTHSLLLAKKVKREFEEAVRLDPANILARRDLIDFHIDAPWVVGGSKEKARQQVEAIAALETIEGHLARAQYWLGEKNLDRAEVEYLRVLELRPNRSGPYFEIADFYLQRDDAARTKQAVEAATSLSPSDHRLAYYRGAAVTLAGERLAEAEQLLKSYLNVPERSDFPSHASALECLGRLYEKLGRRPEAARQYRAALQLDPDRKSALAGLKRMMQR